MQNRTQVTSCPLHTGRPVLLPARLSCHLRRLPGSSATARPESAFIDAQRMPGDGSQTPAYVRSSSQLPAATAPLSLPEMRPPETVPESVLLRERRRRAR